MDQSVSLCSTDTICNEERNEYFIMFVLLSITHHHHHRHGRPKGLFRSYRNLSVWPSRLGVLRRVGPPPLVKLLTYHSCRTNLSTRDANTLICHAPVEIWNTVNICPALSSVGMARRRFADARDGSKYGGRTTMY
jgi:hypothetical protein